MQSSDEEDLDSYLLFHDRAEEYEKEIQFSLNPCLSAAGIFCNLKILSIPHIDF